MKKRYFVPLFAAVSCLLIFLHIVLVSVSASFSSTLLKQEYGICNLVIIRTFAVFASILAGFLVAFPMAYFTRTGKSLVGLAMPLFGIVVVFTPWHQGSTELLRQACLEWIFLFASCAAFWHIGRKARNGKGLAQPTNAPYSSPAEGSKR
ncbi:MAG: hypothetical protein Q8O57_08355 [Kiritimatiellota bacterium]|nr:hypothetical protein [Kiritimatiellota bacterium]